MKQVTLPAIEAPKTVSSVNKQQFITALNRVLPSDCQIRTSQDAWHVATMAAAVMGFIFPPAFIAALYCHNKAQ